MDEALETHKLPRLNRDEIENLNSRSTSEGIESFIKNHPTNQSPGPDGFPEGLHQMLEEWTPILLKLSKNEKRRDLSQTNFTRPASPWYQNQTRAQEKSITGQYHWWTELQKSSTKYQQAELNMTRKGSPAKIKEGLLRDANKGGSASTHRPVSSTALPK